VNETQTGQTWTLPPLILHPFATREDTERLLEGSRLNLTLAGLLPDDDLEADAASKLLVCRYHEIRMLYFVGKDIFRWMEQCQDFVRRTPDLAGLETQEQSFADFLVRHPPEEVRSKLQGWGVTDAAVLFARAIGLRALFAEPPAPESLSMEFLRSYHRYADAIFETYRSLVKCALLTAPLFSFQVYASGEYSRMLEENWMG